MVITINRNILKLKTGDITKQETEAIVNAANGTLLGGGGVDGAIHRAAGPKLLDECKEIRIRMLKGEYLQTGEAVITKGYHLPAKYVIHTVGPIWDGIDQEDKKVLLANCYKNSLNLAKNKEIKSISFPSISTGVYRFPVDQAAEVAMITITDFLKNHVFGKVVMTLFSESDYNTYETVLKRITNLA